MNENLDHVGDDIDFLDLVITLGEEKKLLFGLPLIAGLIAVVVSLCLTPVFTARTTLLPPQGNNSGGAAAALASLGGLAGLAGIGTGGTTVDIVLSMLKSRSAKDRIIEQFDLMDRYETDIREDVYLKLDSLVQLSSDKKSGLITIEVDHEDPVVAAGMANSYYQVLRDLMTRVAVTEAQQRRVFFEKQFVQAKEDLGNAEIALRETQERTGLVELKSQAEVTIGAVARLRAEIVQREVQLSAMRTFATADNADYRRVVAEINGLRAELKKLDKGGNSGDSGLVSAGSLPKQGLEYVRALRDVKYQEAVFEIMAKQFELAKVDEAKDGGDVQQLDIAVAPEKRSKPRRAVIVMLTVLAAGLLAVVLALLKGLIRNGSADPDTRIKLKRLKTAWKVRS